MKNSIVTYCIISLAMLGIVLTSCRKHDHHEDPCLNAIKVTALGDQNIQGQFSGSENGYVQYYFAKNYDKYAKLIIPGHTYMLGYTEVACDNNPFVCGNGIRIGGCIVNRKCILINCIKETSNPSSEPDCNKTLIDPSGFDEAIPSIFNGASISGTTLYANVSFSGCSVNDAVNFDLLTRLVLMRCPTGSDQIFYSKIVNNNKGITCQAIFSKKVCFDLQAIKDYYTKQNIHMPDKVILRIENAGSFQDLNFQLK